LVYVLGRLVGLRLNLGDAVNLLCQAQICCFVPSTTEDLADHPIRKMGQGQN
jgi:hypothetical protein